MGNHSLPSLLSTLNHLKRWYLIQFLKALLSIKTFWKNIKYKKHHRKISHACLLGKYMEMNRSLGSPQTPEFTYTFCPREKSVAHYLIRPDH